MVHFLLRTQRFRDLTILCLVAVLVSSPLRAFASGPHGGGCAFLLMNDRELIDGLPPRMRTVVESARFRRLIVSREKEWEEFHAMLDQGWRMPGYVQHARLGRLEIRFNIEQTPKGGVGLSIDYIRREGLSLGEVSNGDASFLEFLAALTVWVAKKRDQKMFSGVRISGTMLENKRLIQFLESLGAESRKKRMCTRFTWFTLSGVAVGVAGYLAGYFEVEDEKALGPLGGLASIVTFGGMASASLCFSSMANDYTLTIVP